MVVRPMSSSEKLRVLLIRDCLASAALTAYFFLPRDYGIIAVFISIIIMRIASKKLKGTSTKLEIPHKRTYFIVSESLLVIWMVLIALWIIRHISAPAIAMGSLGIIVLPAFSLYVYETIYAKSATV